MDAAAETAELPSILTVKQVQDYLGLSQAGTYELVHSPGFPAIRIGKRGIRILQEEFTQWLTQRRLTP